MILKFSIHYSTVWGESVHVAITYHLADGRKRCYDIAMNTADGDLWTLETAALTGNRSITSFEYTYLIEDQNGKITRREWNRVKRRYPYDNSKNFTFPDLWRDKPLQYHLMSKMFRIVEGRKATGEQPFIRMPLFRKTLIFRVLAPQLPMGKSLGICGNHPLLGNWEPNKYIRMYKAGENDWILSLNVDHITTPLEYKYVVIDNKTNRLDCWEEGLNRTISTKGMADNSITVAYGENLRVNEKPWRAAGVTIPLFSIRTEESFGVGDLGDLKQLTDWAYAMGMKAIQLLPIFDTTTTHTWSDSHPYNCISLHALHPHYIDLNALGQIDDNETVVRYNRQRRELNALPYSDYEAVDRLKLSYIEMFFEKQGEETLATTEYKNFEKENRYWLWPYAAFCTLRERYHTARTSDWHEYAIHDSDKLKKLYREDADFRRGFRLACFTQYHLDKQLRSAVDYAKAKRITLCGDMPVGVYRDSVATWVYPTLFHLDMKLGNPPSAEEPEGQDWGMPPFDWYPDNGNPVARYINRALKGMEKYFGAVRIDHIVSFFRIWEIPKEQLWTVMGHFSPSLPLSEREISQYGLEFHKELFTKPFINDEVIQTFFGIHAEYVRNNFLIAKAYRLYDLKPEFDTQLKISEHFAGRNDENSLWIRDGLMHLCANVLFLKDPYRDDMYYPRYGVYNEPVYSILDAKAKDSFMRLYNNFYYERHNDYWKNLARHKMAKALDGVGMLIYGEDLGLIPEGVDEVLDQERILSLEVQSMPKHNNGEFAHLEANPYRSVAVPTTHDMAPLRLWWEEDLGRTQRYWRTMLQKEGHAPRHLTPIIAEEIIARHLYCPSMLCFISIQDWMAMEPAFCNTDVYSLRINAPYDAYNEWKFRIQPTVKELMQYKQYINKVNTMITRSFRRGYAEQHTQKNG